MVDSTDNGYRLANSPGRVSNIYSAGLAVKNDGPRVSYQKTVVLHGFPIVSHGFPRMYTCEFTGG